MVSQKVRRNYWNCSFIWIFTLYCPGVSLKIFTFFVLTYVEVQLTASTRHVFVTFHCRIVVVLTGLQRAFPQETAYLPASESDIINRLLMPIM